MTRQPTDDSGVIDPAVLAEMLEATAPLAPPSELRDRVLARVRADRESFITVRGDDRTRWRTLTAGVEFKLLMFDTQAHSKSFLLRSAAGTRMPAHSHRRFEECFVLEGEFSIGDIHLCAGDFHGASMETAHGESYTEHGVLVYLRAHIEDYPGIQP